MNDPDALHVMRRPDTDAGVMDGELYMASSGHFLLPESGLVNPLLRETRSGIAAADAFHPS
ncbi:hypothetical protein [Actinomadura rudentiformis]|uniref:Uncharacterized protein n=1 Tax=Actinomadura rudentiformis TaxID=359158 RepID=A0A6H9Y665_9ACTN|nr:hypothetical protein [Actinomadura rudentiformis]KAB2339664.1 hypothetical protein F8566_47505 [Actinomadura rudentiformis]